MDQEPVKLLGEPIQQDPQKAGGLFEEVRRLRHQELQLKQLLSYAFHARRAANICEGEASTVSADLLWGFRAKTFGDVLQRAQELFGAEYVDQAIAETGQK